MIICRYNPVSKANISKKNTIKTNEIKDIKHKQVVNKSHMETQTRVRSKILSISNTCYENPEADLCCNYWLYIDNIETVLERFEKKRKLIDFEKIKNEEQRWDVI